MRFSFRIIHVRLDYKVGRAAEKVTLPQHFAHIDRPSQADIYLYSGGLSIPMNRLQSLEANSDQPVGRQYHK